MDGFLDVGIGALMILWGTGKIRASKDPQKNEVWRAKWGRFTYLVGAGIAIWGLVRMLF